MDEWLDGKWTYGWTMDIWMDNGHMDDKWTYGWTHRLMDGWIDTLDRWMDGLMDGKTSG